MKTYSSGKEKLSNIALSGLLFFSVFFSLSLFLSQKIFSAVLFVICTLLFIKVFLKGQASFQHASQLKSSSCVLLWVGVAITLILHPPSQDLLMYCLFPLSLATSLLLGWKKGVSLLIPALAITLYLTDGDHDISTLYLSMSLIVFLCLLGTCLKYLENLEYCLEQAKTIDPITGCTSITQFKKHIENNAELNRRYKSPVSCLIFDSKVRISEHQQKETFLIELAQICQSRIRQTDIICHYSNCCFLILLPNTDSNNAETLGYDLLQACKAYQFSSDLNDEDFQAFQFELSSYPENTPWETWFNQIVPN